MGGTHGNKSKHVGQRSDPEKSVIYVLRKQNVCK